MLNLNTIFSIVLGSILGGGLGGGLIATYISQRLARGEEKRRVSRGKCEDIFESFMQVKDWINNEIDRWWELSTC